MRQKTSGVKIAGWFLQFAELWKKLCKNRTLPCRSVQALMIQQITMARFGRSGFSFAPKSGVDNSLITI
jgi:hypothetical protein